MDIDIIVNRFKALTGISTDKQAAELLGISASDYSQRKKRKTIIPLIVQWGSDNGTDVSKIFSDEEIPKIGNENVNSAEPVTEYQPVQKTVLDPPPDEPPRHNFTGPVDNLALLELYIQTMEEKLLEKGLAIEPKQKARIIRLLYENALKTGMMGDETEETENVEKLLSILG